MNHFGAIERPHTNCRKNYDSNRANKDKSSTRKTKKNRFVKKERPLNRVGNRRKRYKRKREKAQGGNRKMNRIRNGNCENQIPNKKDGAQWPLLCSSRHIISIDMVAWQRTLLSQPTQNRPSSTNLYPLAFIHGVSLLLCQNYY